MVLILLYICLMTCFVWSFWDIEVNLSRHLLGGRPGKRRRLSSIQWTCLFHFLLLCLLRRTISGTWHAFLQQFILRGFRPMCTANSVSDVWKICPMAFALRFAAFIIRSSVVLLRGRSTLFCSFTEFGGVLEPKYVSNCAILEESISIEQLML